MDTTKKHFIERANKIGILFVRERNSEEDRTGWGALEFTLKNGEIFIIAGYEFGQGDEEHGLWVDMNVINPKIFPKMLKKIKRKLSEIKKAKEEHTISSWLNHQLIYPNQISPEKQR